MFYFKISLLNLYGGLTFEFKSRFKENTLEFKVDIMTIFQYIHPDRGPSIHLLQTNSVDIQNSINNLVQKYRKNIPEINGLNSFFKNLGENEPFIFLPGDEMNKLDHSKLRSHIKAKIEGKSVEEIEKETLKFFGDSIKKYFIEGFGSLLQKIGQPIKQKRICRFCQRSMPDVTFNQKAHAISEALGNKTLILFDECDACNHRFSTTIEPQLIEYLSLFKTVFGVKGKDGATKYKGKKFVISKEANNVLIQFTDVKPPKRNGKSYDMTFPSFTKIASQDLYRCLCKYFLSVVDKSEIGKFAETIRWIKKEIDIPRLPLIAESLTYDRASLQPRLTMYLRKRKSKHFPYAVCEFQFTIKRFVFIVPLCTQDQKDFINKADFQKYWNVFKQYKNVGNWVFIDFSSTVPKEFQINLSGKMTKKRAVVGTKPVK